MRPPSFFICVPWMLVHCGVCGTCKPATQSLKLFSWDYCLLVFFKVFSITKQRHQFISINADRQIASARKRPLGLVLKMYSRRFEYRFAGTRRR